MPRSSTAVPATATSWPNRLASPFLHLLIITLLGLLAYSDSFQVPFIFDDDLEIKQNPVIRDLGSFLSGAGFAYNPRRFVGYLSFALNYRFGGLDVTGYHVVNFSIHVLAAWLVYFMVRLTLRTPYFDQRQGDPPSPTLQSYAALPQLLPLLCALLFVLHPIQTQAVTYLVQRFASLATMFYLLSVVCYIRARLFQEEKGSLVAPAVALFFLLSVAAAILAMSTKEIAATLPLVVALYEFSFFKASRRKKIMFLGALLLTALVIPLVLLFSHGELVARIDALTRETRLISRGDYLLTQFSVVATYIRLIFLPVGQNLDYDYPITHSLAEPRAFLSLVPLLALVALALYLHRRSRTVKVCAGSGNHLRLISFGIFWFFITLSVESSVIPITDVIYEHRLYLPSAGAFVAVAAALLLILPALSRARFAAVSLLLAALLVITWQRNQVWKDPVTLWSDVAAKSPKKVRAYNNIVTALIAGGRIDEAIRISAAPLALNPRDPSAHRNLGSAFEKKGLLDEAIVQYRIALALRPGDALASYNLGVAYDRKGLPEQAASCFLQCIAAKKDYIEAYNNLGAVYARAGRIDDAIHQFENALHYDPNNVTASRNLAFAYQKKLSRPGT